MKKSGISFSEYYRTYSVAVGKLESKGGSSKALSEYYKTFQR